MKKQIILCSIFLIFSQSIFAMKGLKETFKQISACEQEEVGDLINVKSVDVEEIKNMLKDELKGIIDGMEESAFQKKTGLLTILYVSIGKFPTKVSSLKALEKIMERVKRLRSDLDLLRKIVEKKQE